MSLQHERIAKLCEHLKLARLGAEWLALAQDAPRDEASFADSGTLPVVEPNAGKDDPAPRSRPTRCERRSAACLSV